MHHATAAELLRELAKRELLQVKHTTFRYPPYPQPFHQRDVKEAFLSVAGAAKAKKSHIVATLGTGLEVLCEDGLFEKLFRVIFTSQKLFPKSRSDSYEGDRGRVNPLPTLFVSGEKTQVRQVPLVDAPPWPFKFLLELGGMVVCRPSDRGDFLKELKQYLNNFPQYRLKVHADEWPDGSVVVVTTYFEKLKLLERKGNVNVP